jgi:beta-galactosidase
MSKNNGDRLLPRLLHGGDYNPEQWPEAVWNEDMELMKRANWHIATVPVFGWVHLQPDEETFTFDWLDRLLNKLVESGLYACLATATASQPAWLDEKYSDVLVADSNGVRRRHGNRHSFCPSSPNFRRLSTSLARTIAERYKEHPALLLWHVSNEYGTYCYCNVCAAAFREWLAARYGSLEELNRRWYTTFWGHTFTAWSQVEPPYSNGEGSNQGLRLDWNRFQSDSLLNCYRAEAAVLREITPDVPVTTNLMGTYYPLNYHEWAKELDIVSWDNYPGPSDPPSHIAFTHAVMRGLKEGKPFLLMEQSPSQQNWQPYNSLKAPGALRLQSFQAVAQGAESVMYFQWRRSRGAVEKLHGAIVEHPGRTDTRVFREVAALGQELSDLGNRTLGGRVPAKVAILFDWENWWSLGHRSGPSRDLDYLKECRAVYDALFALGIQTEVVSPGADLSPYKVIIAPVLYLMREEFGKRVSEQVNGGATFLTTFFSGLVDETDVVHSGGAPGPLREVLGLWIEETDALPPGKTNGMRFLNGFGGLLPEQRYEATLLCERIRLESAEPLAVYTDDFYAGEPALTVNRFGMGQAYFLATKADTIALEGILHGICQEQGVVSPLAHGAPPPKGVEVSVRVSPEGQQLLYLLNHNHDTVTVLLHEGIYTDLLTGEMCLNTVALPSLGVRILSI